MKRRKGFLRRYLVKRKQKESRRILRINLKNIIMSILFNIFTNAEFILPIKNRLYCNSKTEYNCYIKYKHEKQK